MADDKKKEEDAQTKDEAKAVKEKKQQEKDKKEPSKTKDSPKEEAGKKEDSPKKDKEKKEDLDKVEEEPSKDMSPGVIDPVKKPDEETPESKTDDPSTKIDRKGKPSEDESLEVDSYGIYSGDLEFTVKVFDVGDYVLHYEVQLPHVDFVTRALLDETKRSLVGEIQLESRDIMSSAKIKSMREKFLARSKTKLKNVLKRASDEYVNVLSLILVNEMVGLGDIEYLLMDDSIEEVVVNSSKDMVWVYHKRHGWVKTNINIPTEEMIMNYASRVAREVGREITHMEPLLDAHLSTGDRVNATLFPISTRGNTMTIRRFSRTPWTIIHLIDPRINTINARVAAFLWVAIEYEMSMLVAGGTASGKTSMLNALMPFFPANQRIITIEDTRELNLPEYQHWIPLTSRPANPQGEGEVSMLNLMENALRMRPDRIVVGEVRARKEAEVLFEAMHTGHSVYGTFHAEQATEVVDRLCGPPMNIPPLVLKSLHLVLVQYRNRRTGWRRTFEVAEITKDEGETPSVNTLFMWHPKTDTVEPMYPSIRVKDELELFTGMSEKELQEDLKGKQLVLEWMLAQNIRDVNDVGKIITEYYIDKETVLDLVSKGDKALEELQS
ncbi:MAG: ATPase, T2SS/T4P/T4SS family [Candidatus Altiarchaeota archaeon]